MERGGERRGMRVGKRRKEGEGKEESERDVRNGMRGEREVERGGKREKGLDTRGKKEARERKGER